MVEADVGNGGHAKGYDYLAYQGYEQLAEQGNQNWHGCLPLGFADYGMPANHKGNKDCRKNDIRPQTPCALAHAFIA
jgi:hypothetical protein